MELDVNYADHHLYEDKQFPTELETSQFCFELHELVLSGRERAYGVCDFNGSRPFRLDLSQLAPKLSWQRLFGVIVSDLGVKEH